MLVPFDICLTHVRAHKCYMLMYTVYTCSEKVHIFIVDIGKGKKSQESLLRASRWY
ncbi:hypothetical protein VCRA2116O30_70022 [Vibrio crassostreae]|nr:hypothetical protein VCRA2116O28_10287 [Vibrio crassostreae]CAK1862177.1 hypothetical protein VCRA2116O27_10287 [Vibrio crassostreae]CAK1864199.1 hypothetical protein VCRA2117O38_10287 [Vibrio crassostreae]CAK1871739.1 hypothetical protein VCRA2117O40_10286 [Vibrio crassostreae]CAK1876435.1 hypothetical protein VCRA2113O22_10288 [Vibrio crassostreae]